MFWAFLFALTFSMGLLRKELMKLDQDRLVCVVSIRNATNLMKRDRKRIRNINLIIRGFLS